MDEFHERNRRNIAGMSQDAGLRELTRQWFIAATRYEYSYHFSWLGRPIIQFPQDVLAIQEIIWRVRPDLIVETGIAHGGSLIFHASLLELLGGDGRVVGIDVDIRAHNRVEIEKHPLFPRITMLQGSSTAEEIVRQVREIALGKQRVMVVLDSNHTHAHVLQELQSYGPLVTPGSYLIVLDTIIEEMPGDSYPDRPWGRGNNPRTAVWEYLKTTDRFEIDEEIQNKLLITVAPDGYLRCVGT
jgi:cephalosporin hydroxylase